MPVPLSDQASSEVMDIINKINYAVASFENPQILCNSLVYVRPELAEYTFVQMVDTQTYLLKLMGSSALREGIIKHLNTMNRLISNPSCELFPQLRLDLDLTEVSGGKFFQISKRKFIDCPLEAKEFGKVSPLQGCSYPLRRGTSSVKIFQGRDHELFSRRRNPCQLSK